MSTTEAPSTTAAELPKRPDDASIENISGRLIEFENALLKVFEKNPGYYTTYVRELLAKFEEGLTYNEALRKKSLDEAPDITIHPDALVRKFPAVLFIDQPNGVCGMIDLLLAFHQRSPTLLDLFLDTEDDAVAGGLSILQLFVHSANVIYLLDMRALGQSAFTTTSSFGQTLKDVLESASIRKAFYAIAGDYHTLYKHYGIRLAGITDLALMALACDGSKRKERDVGLAQAVNKCRKRFLFSVKETEDFKARKDWGYKVVFPETQQKVEELREAGKLETTDWVPLFNQRLLPKEVYDYVIWDVLVMPVVYSVLGDAIGQLKHPFERLDDPKLQAESAEKFAILTARKAKLGDKTWTELVEQKTSEVLKASQTAGFDRSVREGKTGGCLDWSELQY